MITMEEMLTVEDVARILQFSPYYVRKLCRDGELKAIRTKVGGHWRIKQEDLRAFVDRLQPEEDQK